MIVMHFNYLDGTRAMAALYVLIHHTLMQMAYEDSFFFAVLHDIFQHGRFAVDFFIVLSGFCLIIPLLKNDDIQLSRNFLKRRAKRILPTYYIAMVLSLVLIHSVIGEKTGSHWDAAIPVTTWDIFTHLFLIQDLFGETAYKINHAFWSISVECRIYLLFPFIIKLCNKTGILIVIILSIVVSFVLWHVYPRIGLNPYTMSPHYLPLFMFGMLASYLSFNKKHYYIMLKEKYLNSIAIPLLVTVCILLFVMPSVFPTLSFSTLSSDYLMGTGAAVFLLLLSAERIKLLNKLFSWYPLVFVGTFAYSIYLIHAPILQIISQYIVVPLKLSGDMNLICMIFLGVSVNLILAYFFYVIAERPYIRKQAFLKAV